MQDQAGAASHPLPTAAVLANAGFMFILYKIEKKTFRQQVAHYESDFMLKLTRFYDSDDYQITDLEQTTNEN